MKRDEFISKIAIMAQKDAQKSKILASVTIAQAIIESGFGESGLTKSANNLFGIKGKYNGCSYICDTFEYVNGRRIMVRAEFRKYPTWKESINDHSAFLLGNSQNRYKAVVGERSYKKACEALQQAGYATAPTYASALIRIIEDYELNLYDKPIIPEYQVRVFTFSDRAKANVALAKIKKLGYYAQIEEMSQ